MGKKRKFDWMIPLKIFGALVTVAGVAFSLVTGAMFGNTEKIFGVITMPLFGWVVALAGFLLFIWARNKQVSRLQKEQEEEFNRQMNEQNTQRQVQEIQNIQAEKELSKRGPVVLIKKKELIQRRIAKSAEHSEIDEQNQDEALEQIQQNQADDNEKLPQQKAEVEQPVAKEQVEVVKPEAKKQKTVVEKMQKATKSAVKKQNTEKNVKQKEAVRPEKPIKPEDKHADFLDMFIENEDVIFAKKSKKKVK